MSCQFLCSMIFERLGYRRHGETNESNDCLSKPYMHTNTETHVASVAIVFVKDFEGVFDMEGGWGACLTLPSW